MTFLLIFAMIEPPGHSGSCHRAGIEMETQSETSFLVLRPRLKSFGLRLQDLFRDQTFLVSINDTDTETEKS